jgi:uncharacterized protein YjiS (DUF1127 family)
MILRTDFSTPGVSARPAGISSKILTALLTPFFTRNQSAGRLTGGRSDQGRSDQGRFDIARLSDRQLRDIGIEMDGRAIAMGFLLTDIAPPAAFFGQRRRRWQ